MTAPAHEWLATSAYLPNGEPRGRLHAVPAEADTLATEVHATPALCGLLPRSGWTFEMPDQRCMRCTAAIARMGG